MNVKTWTSYCGLTCYGGSEHRECKCTGPHSCEMRLHLDFPTERSRAIDRMKTVTVVGATIHKKDERLH